MVGEGCKICGATIVQAERSIKHRIYCSEKCRLIMYCLREAKKLMKGRIKWKLI